MSHIPCSSLYFDLPIPPLSTRSKALRHSLRKKIGEKRERNRGNCKSCRKVFLETSNLEVRLRGGYDKFWLKKQFFFTSAKCPSYHIRLICKIPRSQDFFTVKKNVLFEKNFFFAFFPIPMSRIICISFYNIKWYIIYSIRLHVASSLRKLCFREKFFFRDISFTVLRIVWNVEKCDF